MLAKNATKIRYTSKLRRAFFSAWVFISFPALAQELPGSADASRIELLEQPVISSSPPSSLTTLQVQPNVTIPDAAKQVSFLLGDIDLQGVTAFSRADLLDIYQPYLHQEITLDTIWMIAGQLTERYQQSGYFLSRAYVPEQEIDDGIVTIKVVEGSVVELVLSDETLAERAIIRQLIARIKAQKPLNAYELESFMLQMNALSGVEFRAFVEPVEDAPAGVTRLLLSPAKEPGKGIVSFDNFGSRFLGPYQTTITYQDSFMPLQQTTFSALASAPTDELKYLAFRHAAPLFPDWSLELSGSYVTAEPGASLASSDISSDSVELGVGVSWQPIRQRQENLIASLTFTGKNSNGDILDNNPLTRDRIRAVRGRLTYDAADGWSGYNYVAFAINHGLEMLGASKQGEANLSRIEAKPDFTTARFSYTRQQAITNDFMAIGQFSGQLASGPLFSSEEFGYGGQGFGRAYDPSEITGDHGMAASLELRYTGFASWQSLSFVPYTFYDLGKVWNEDSGEIDGSGSSAGMGLRLSHSSGVSGNLGVAWPLTRESSNPIYGSGKDPRILLQLGYVF